MPDDDNQFEVPSTFALAAGAAGHVTPEAVRDRYELCEDLATQLQEFCAARRGALGRDECLLRCHAGLADPASGVDAAEARWIVQRTAERLDWRCPALPPDAAGD